MRKEIIALLVIFLIIILGSIFFSRLEQRGLQGELLPNRSTYNSRPTGCKAFYLLLGEMGFETDRWQLPMEKLDRYVSSTTLLVMINPWDMAGTCSGEDVCSFDPEVKGLLSWVNEGGNLFIIDDSDSSRGILSSLGTEVEKTQEIWEAEEQTLLPIIPTAYMRRVETVRVQGDAHTTSDVSDEAIVHLKNKDGPVLISQTSGEGRITILTAPYVASNQGIDKGDNVILLTNIIAKEGKDRKILFDEYHHGYDSSLSVLGYYRNTPVGWVCLQVLVISLALFYSLSRHFGKPRTIAKEQSRSIMEYVKSMASLYYKADLRNSLLRDIYLRYKNLWIRKLGLSPNMGLEQLCALISARADLNPSRFLKTMSRCERVCRNEIQADRGELLNLVRQLEIYGRKIYGHG